MLNKVCVLLAAFGIHFLCTHSAKADSTGVDTQPQFLQEYIWDFANGSTHYVPMKSPQNGWTCFLTGIAGSFSQPGEFIKIDVLVIGTAVIWKLHGQSFQPGTKAFARCVQT